MVFKSKVHASKEKLTFEVFHHKTNSVKVFHMSDNLLLFITVLVNTSRKLTQVTRIHPKLNIEGSWSLSNPYVGDFF